MLQARYINIQSINIKYKADYNTNIAMQEHTNRKVHPGLKICKHSDQNLGYGLYPKEGSVYASAFGILISSTANGVVSYSISNNLPTKKMGLTVGDIVYGRVLRVRDQQCIIEILQVNRVSCIAKGGRGLEGAIRKENVRQKMVDSVVMIESFKPRDIVKAKVVSLGDSLRGIYLTTAHENLGVIVAEHEQTGRLMLPFDWAAMIDPEELTKQTRKVCKPQ